MKVALISDLHFGIKKSDLKFQKSQLAFFEKQLVEELKQRDIKDIFVLGDIFDTRQSVNVQTNNIVLKLFKDTLKDFNVKIIVGNHDLYYTDTTEVNSLKQLNLLSNVIVYEKPETFDMYGHSMTFMPWITDYNNINFKSSEFCFAHMDVAGFMMDKYNMCSNGVPVKKLVENFKHVYTGHFHTRSKKTIGNCDIEYIGSPYQLTRIDAEQDRGCTILDLDTNNAELIVNDVSIKYVKITYPDLPENLKEVVSNNIVDIDIPYEVSDQSKNIVDYMQKVNANNPILVSQNIGKKPELIAENIEKDLSGIDLYSLFKSYVDKIQIDVNKTDLYKELINLYNTFKRRIIKMEQRNITLKRGQVKSIYEYFMQLLQQEGKNAEFSYMIYKNAESLSSEYANIVKSIYNENADSKYKEYIQKCQEILLKYADRDEQGNPIAAENGNIKVTEQIAEYKAEIDELYANNKNMLDERQQKIQESIQFLEVTSEYVLIVLPVDKFPDNTIPAIVGIFGI